MPGAPERIVIPGRARLWLGDGTAVAPTTAISTMPVGWRDVGLTAVDGLSFQRGFEQLSVMSHQSDYTTRKAITSRSGRMNALLQEWSGDNFLAAQGGGTVTEVSTGVYKYTPPAGNNEELQACLEIIDGTKHYRYIVPSGSVAEGFDQSLVKTAESTLPFALDVQGQDGVPPWYLLTDDPAFEPA